MGHGLLLKNRHRDVPMTRSIPFRFKMGELDSSPYNFQKLEICPYNSLNWKFTLHILLLPLFYPFLRFTPLWAHLQLLYLCIRRNCPLLHLDKAGLEEFVSYRSIPVLPTRILLSLSLFGVAGGGWPAGAAGGGWPVGAALEASAAGRRAAPVGGGGAHGGGGGWRRRRRSWSETLTVFGGGNSWRRRLAEAP
jgi:hypothetical protein